MKASFDNIVASNIPVVVDFFAEWCGPCKSQAPILKEVAHDLGDKVRIIKVDVDKNNELALRYKIQSVPTIMIFINSEVRFRQSGVLSKGQLLATIASFYN